jgi:hypothetical protein
VIQHTKTHILELAAGKRLRTAAVNTIIMNVKNKNQRLQKAINDVHTESGNGFDDAVKILGISKDYASYLREFDELAKTDIKSAVKLKIEYKSKLISMLKVKAAAGG